MSSSIALVFIGMAVVVGGILWLRLHAFVALLLGALIVGLLTLPSAVMAYSPALAAISVPARLAKGFGVTCEDIGIVIAMASIIGVCLLETGAAERIVRSTIGLVGERLAPLAFLISSFMLAIPIFFDTVFYMMIPLAKAAGVRAPKQYVACAGAIIAGGVMAHSLVPPTPGPLQMAQLLHVSIASMIFAGLAVGSVTSTAGFLFALWANRRWPISVRATPDVSLEELQALAAKGDSDLPPLWLSLVPIVLPLVLIAAPAFYAKSALLAFFGEKNMALILAAMVALAMLMTSNRKAGRRTAPMIEKALLNAGLIILIVGAGGAFGLMLKATNVAAEIKGMSQNANLALIPLAWLVASVVRTAQGSATVAMITAAGIVGGFAEQGLPYHPVYLAMAIGCGSKVFFWMNDSSFWVISRMAGWTESETLKIGTTMLLIMGLVGLPTTMLLAKFFPFAG